MLGVVGAPLLLAEGPLPTAASSMPTWWAGIFAPAVPNEAQDEDLLEELARIPFMTRSELNRLLWQHLLPQDRVDRVDLSVRNGEHGSMPDGLQDWLQALAPAVVLGAVSLYIATRGARRADFTDLSNKVQELANKVAKLTGTVEAGMEQIRERLSNLEQQPRGRGRGRG